MLLLTGITPWRSTGVKIAVEMDGVEIDKLTEGVCDNGYLLRLADKPGKLIAEAPLLPVSRFNDIQCSTAHFTEADNNWL